MYPKLNGQHASYLAKQLHDYKLAAETGGEQGRANAIMQGQVASLSEQDIADLAAYFASQDQCKALRQKMWLMPPEIIPRW